MSDVIYKYGPFSTSKNAEPIEYAGTPVYVGYQDIGYPVEKYEVFMWCRLSDNASGGKAKIVATGEEYTGRYIGTTVMPSGLVWHVIEV